jgi:hypothetical protein
MVFMFNKESGYSRMWAWGLACIGSRAHVGVVWKPRARCVLRTTRAEEQGEEEEGH